MENLFFVDSGHLSLAAQAKKCRLETDPSFRKNYMEYLPGMEKIDSNVCENVLSQMQSYDPLQYSVKDIKSALQHET